MYNVYGTLLQLPQQGTLFLKRVMLHITSWTYTQSVISFPFYLKLSPFGVCMFVEQWVQCFCVSVLVLTRPSILCSLCGIILTFYTWLFPASCNNSTAAAVVDNVRASAASNTGGGDLVTFHERCGTLVKLTNDRRTAERQRPLDEFNNGVVMTARPLRSDERFEVSLGLIRVQELHFWLRL